MLRKLFWICIILQICYYIECQAILFSHPFMLVLSLIYIIYFIISKTIYS
ncbi:hypothetical protein [Spiroplasma platyhelix]